MSTRGELFVFALEKYLDARSKLDAAGRAPFLDRNERGIAAEMNQCAEARAYLEKMFDYALE